MIIEKIKEEWKQIRKSPSLLTILLVILGIVLLVHPRGSIGFVIRATGIVLLLEGGYRMYQSYHSPTRGAATVFRSLDVVLGIAGLFILLKPSSLIRLFPSVVGILLIIWGLFRLWVGRMTEGPLDKKDYVGILFRAFPLLLGIFLFVFPFSAVDVAVRLTGAYLVIGIFVDRGVPKLFSGKFAPKNILRYFTGEDEDLFEETFSFKDFMGRGTSGKGKEGPDVDVVDSSYGSPDDIMADYRVLDEEDEES
ncbi:MAG: DUF308 domain-containing protein [Blautia sp.]|nr:DUF308 domain-containing protein [Blautia sp.]